MTTVHRDQNAVTGRPGARLTVMWFLGHAALNAVWGAVPSVLIALQLQRMDPDAKVGNLALITGAAALLSVIVQPLAGRLSDGTRSRFGRRTVWIVGGAVVGAAAIVAMSFATDFPSLFGLYMLVVIGINAAGLPFSTTLVERIPAHRRGTFSALGAIGQFFGIVGGQAIAALLVDSMRAAYLIVAGLAIVVMLLFVLLNPDPSRRTLASDRTVPTPEAHAGPARVGVRELLSAFWVDPRRHPDFAWVVLGRFLLGLGFYLVISYNLYLLQGYVGLTEQQAAAAIPLLSLAAGATMAVSTIVSGPLSDRLGRRKVFLYAASGVFAIGLAVPLVMPTVTGMVISQLLGGLAFGCMGSVDQALLTQVLPSEADIGKDLGIGAIALNIPQAIAPFAAAAIISTAGYAPLFAVGAVLAVLGGVSVAFIRSVR